MHCKSVKVKLCITEFSYNYTCYIYHIYIYLQTMQHYGQCVAYDVIHNQ